jgi:hypothetical protein
MGKYIAKATIYKPARMFAKIIGLTKVEKGRKFNI